MPVVATPTPSACAGSSDSPRTSTESTTVRPPYDAATGLTTLIGP